MNEELSNRLRNKPPQHKSYSDVKKGAIKGRGSNLLENSKFQPYQKNKLSLLDDDNLDSNLKSIKIGDEISPIMISKSQVNINTIEVSDIKLNGNATISGGEDYTIDGSTLTLRQDLNDSGKHFQLNFFHDTKANTSPGAIGKIFWKGYNLSDELCEFAEIEGKSMSITNGTEYGKLSLKVLPINEYPDDNVNPVTFLEGYGAAGNYHHANVIIGTGFATNLYLNAGSGVTVQRFQPSSGPVSKRVLIVPGNPSGPDISYIKLEGADQDDYLMIKHDGSKAAIIETIDEDDTDLAHLTLDCDGDITLDAKSGNIYVKDNGGNYTPGSDYEIATKKYVDDNVGGGSGDMTGVDLTGGTGISIDSETNTTSGDYSATITCNLEGTEVASTGVTSDTKYLKSNGSGGSSWSSVPTEWTCDADTSQTGVEAGGTLTISGGTGISTSISGSELTITNTVTNTDVDVSVANLDARLNELTATTVTVGDATDVNLKFSGDVQVGQAALFVNLPTLASGLGTHAWQWAEGNKMELTLISGANTIVFDNPQPLYRGNFLLKLKQPSSGAAGTVSTWSVSGGGAIKWSGGGTAPTLSTSNNYEDILTFYFDGTNYYGMFAGDFQ